MTTPIERNREENIDLLQIEYFSDLPISKKEIVIIEPNNSTAITMRKFLLEIGFEEIHICKETKEGMEIFYDYISNDVNVPLIIDIGTNKNIKTTIKEILEIQPSAMILVVTAKERTDAEIVKLLDMGISSIIQKPVLFEEFKKSFSYLFENKEEIKIKKQVEKKEEIKSELFSTNQMTDNKFKDLLKLNQLDAETKIKDLIVQRKVIPEKEVLEAACNLCGSTNITYVAECPSCHGIDFEQKKLIECYSCGKVYPKESETRKCTECNRDLGSPGIGYRETSELYICSSCNDRFPKPASKFICLDCNHNFTATLAVWKKSRVYKIQK